MIETSTHISSIKESETAPGTIATLAGTSDKISSIDMDKNFGEAGNILDGFYSGSKAKKGTDSSVVYAEPGSAQRPAGQAGKEICNAEPSKIRLAGKVPPLNSGPEKSSPKGNGFPVGVGMLAAGVAALAMAGKRKSCSHDVDTIVDAAQHPIDTIQDLWNYVKPGSSDTKPPKDPDDPPSSTPSDPFAVHPSGGAVTCIGPSCGLP